jgi:hypothetical protein
MRILVLCSNSVLGIGVIRCLGIAGHWVCALGTRAFPFYRLSRYCAAYQRLAEGGLCAARDALALQINEMSARHGIELIVAADLPAGVALGEVASLLNTRIFPLTDPGVLRQLHDKWTFAQLLAENRLPHPRTALIERAEDLKELEIAGPWIVKPRDGEGGIGISRAETAAQLEETIRGAKRAMLVQEFIPGSDIDLSFLADHGRLVAWTIQTGAPPSPRRVFHKHPGVLEIGRALAAASGYHGVAHVDMRIDERDGSVKVLEINPRFWNTLCHSMCMGVNFPDLGIRMMGGESIDGEKLQPVGNCDSFEMSPLRIAQAVISRHPPASVGNDAEGIWRMTGNDPLPDLCRWVRRAFPSLASKGGGASEEFCAGPVERYNSRQHETLAA